MSNINITVDFSVAAGPVKPMHSVNNGPVIRRSGSNVNAFKDAGFPFVRNHDAAFCSSYGGEHTVDIINIFPDFSKDENDPASYDFHMTDEYLEQIMATGAKVFYRLGNKIEHGSKRYGAVPPADYEKWARVCEHIIRHMNEGWANGHEYGIEYWEIWNEPDLHPQCWDGANADFYPLYDITARHLKKCFPHLKIGGPAITRMHCGSFIGEFFDYLTRNPADPTPLDFFSFHRYATEPAAFGNDAREAREICNQYGYTQTELVLDEWNWVRKDKPEEEMLCAYHTMRSLKGASFVAGSVITAQQSPLDHFMYYDARSECTYNGLFDFYSSQPMPPYWSLYAFNRLYDLGTEAKSETDHPEIYASAAFSPDRKKAAVLFTWYRDGKSLDGLANEDEPVRVRLNWKGFFSPDGVEAEYRILDSEHSLDAVSSETFFGENGSHVWNLHPYTVVLAELRKKEG